jgi:hypothetical protein
MSQRRPVGPVQAQRCWIVATMRCCRPPNGGGRRAVRRGSRHRAVRVSGRAATGLTGAGVDVTQVNPQPCYQVVCALFHTIIVAVECAGSPTSRVDSCQMPACSVSLTHLKMAACVASSMGPDVGARSGITKETKVLYARGSRRRAGGSALPATQAPRAGAQIRRGRDRGGLCGPGTGLEMPAAFVQRAHAVTGRDSESRSNVQARGPGLPATRPGRMLAPCLRAS